MKNRDKKKLWAYAGGLWRFIRSSLARPHYARRAGGRGPKCLVESSDEEHRKLARGVIEALFKMSCTDHDLFAASRDLASRGYVYMNLFVREFFTEVWAEYSLYERRLNRRIPSRLSRSERQDRLVGGILYDLLWLYCRLIVRRQFELATEFSLMVGFTPEQLSPNQIMSTMVDLPEYQDYLKYLKRHREQEALRAGTRLARTAAMPKVLKL